MVNIHSLADKFKDKLNVGSSSSHKLVEAKPASADSLNKPPSKRQIYQNRFNVGTNLGSIFVLEKWISPSLFVDSAKGTSELAAVSAYVKEKGEDAAKAKWNDHFHNFVSDDDLQWLQDNGAKGVRIPFGFWIVDNGRFAKGTPFEPYAKVYAEAWTAYKDLVKRADKYDLAVLVDLHALPGGANDGDHSGTDSKKVEFWGSSSNNSKAFEVLEFIAGDLVNFDNVSGIQIVNESPWANDNRAQESYCLGALSAIRSKNPDVPVVVSDGWNIGKWNDTIKGWEDKLSSEVGHPASLGLIIDTHVYRCFSDDDKGKTPEQHVEAMKGGNPIGKNDQVDALVGEYSCVMDGKTWEKLPSGASRDDLCKQFGTAETNCFQADMFSGSYFWTFKFEAGSGGEWDYKEMVSKGCVCYKPNYDKATGDEKDRRKGDALNGHRNYWQNVDNNKDWQHWRFEKGFDQAWQDCWAFAVANKSELGRVAAWARSRYAEHLATDGISDVSWVYQEGFLQGVKQYKEVVRS